MFVAIQATSRLEWWRRKARWRWRSSEPVALWENQVLRHCQVRWTLPDVWHSGKMFQHDSDDDAELTFSCLSTAPYVKVYLLENGACIAKKKTKVARKTLDPLYQQQLPFEENPAGKVLQVRLGAALFGPTRGVLLSHCFSPRSSPQVIVWGDYGRMDHKSFMGAVQILLDELDLSNMVIGWYKLFPPSSLVDPTLAPLTRRASQSSLDSFSRS